MSVNMTDPLTLLREYYLNKKEIIEQDHQIIFGEFSWPKNAKTYYQTYGSGKGEFPKQYYTLECLLFFLKNAHYKHPLYVREAAAAKIPAVRRPDRQNLLAFLNGETQTLLGIDKTVLFEIPMQGKRIADNRLESNSTKKPRLENTYVQRAKEQLVARLDAPKEGFVSAEKIKSLSETMTEDKIADIKAKRLARKRTSIKANLDIENLESDFRAILDMDVDETKDIISRERQYRNRHTILQSSKTVFADNIFGILSSIKAREEKTLMPPPSMLPSRSTPASRPPLSAPARPKPEKVVYNRYDQERFSQSKETGEFNIDTTGTYHGMSLESVTEGTNPAYRKPSPVAAKPTSGLLPTSSAKFTPKQAAQNKRSSRTPIIIVPPTVNTSLITMQNAKDILQDLRFITNEEKRSQGLKRTDEFILQRCKEGHTVPYRVIDNPKKLTKEEWERVVAVFAMGPQWQFKGWPFNGNPVEIFSKICAFHIKYDEMPIDANIARWSVSVIELSKTKRHLDHAAIMKFWEVLDKHLMKTKTDLRF